MKTVLVPTDFNLRSLIIVDALVATNSSESLKIVFVHAFKISDSISDLLMLSRRNKDYEHISDEFYAQMAMYKQKYASKIESISVSYFYGSTTVAFRNFTENLEVDRIAYLDNYQFKPINKYSIDPSNLISRSKCEVQVINPNAITTTENLYETKIQEAKVGVLSPQV